MDKTVDETCFEGDDVSHLLSGFATTKLYRRNNKFVMKTYFLRVAFSCTSIYSNDIERRSKVYLSDWTDGFKNIRKVIPAVLFLYFACLSPAIR